MPDPDAATTAAALVDDAALDCESSDLDLWKWALKARTVLRQVAEIETKARASERQRIRQLAIDHAVMVKCLCHVASDGKGNFKIGAEHLFADLLDGDDNAR